MLILTLHFPHAAPAPQVSGAHDPRARGAQVPPPLPGAGWRQPPAGVEGDDELAAFMYQRRNAEKLSVSQRPAMRGGQTRHMR